MDQTPVADSRIVLDKFKADLKRLYEDSGRPSAAALTARAREAGCEVGAIAKATLSDFVRGKYRNAVPDRQFVLPLVAGCLAVQGKQADEIADELRVWEERWDEVLLESGRAPQPRRPVKERTERDDSEPTAPPARRHWWILKAGVVVLAAVVGLIAGGTVTRWIKGPPNIIEFAPCGEGLMPRPASAFRVVLYDWGPQGTPNPNRRIEIRAQLDAAERWIVWAQLLDSTSNLDRLWLDWSYQYGPADHSQWRTCGPQPVTEAAHTPAVLARDTNGNPRWFRACGQVPPEERPPGRNSNFCTSWSRPDV